MAATCHGTGKVPSAEEHAIHDYEGFHGLKIGEHESIDRVAELAELIDEHGPAFAAYAGYVGIEHATAEDFQDAYNGEWKDEEDFADHTIDEGLWGEIPEHLANYIDTEKMVRDLFMGDYYSVENPDGGIFVFRSM